MKKILVCFSLIILLIFTVGCNRYSESIWQEKYDLGERYLLEENYEQAAIIFEELIEIDPMRPEGYTKAAEAYIALERFDDAQDIIQLGFERTGDASLEPEQLYSRLYHSWADNVWQQNYELGIKYLEDDEYSLAQECFDKMIFIYPDRPEGYEKAAEMYLKMDDYESAEKTLEEGYEKTKDPSVNPEKLHNEWASLWKEDLPVFTEKDLDLFENMINQTTMVWLCAEELDAENITVSQIINEMLLANAFPGEGLYTYFFDEDNNIMDTYVEPDPLGRFEEGAYPLTGRYVDWITQNWFNLTIDRSLFGENYYFDKDTLYIAAELGYGSGVGYRGEITDYQVLSSTDNLYEITFQLNTYGSDEIVGQQTFYFQAYLKNDEQMGHFWCVSHMFKSKYENLDEESVILDEESVDIDSDRKYQSYESDIIFNSETGRNCYLGLHIDRENDNTTLSIMCWDTELLASQEDFFIDNYDDSTEFTAIGNRNQSEYSFVVQIGDAQVELTIERIRDGYNVVPEGKIILKETTNE